MAIGRSPWFLTPPFLVPPHFSFSSTEGPLFSTTPSLFTSLVHPKSVELSFLHNARIFEVFRRPDPNPKSVAAHPSHSTTPPLT